MPHACPYANNLSQTKKRRSMLFPKKLFTEGDKRKMKMMRYQCFLNHSMPKTKRLIPACLNVHALDQKKGRRMTDNVSKNSRESSEQR
jgi:hypothetical protein